MILRRCGILSCNHRAHDPPMIAIPTADDCRSLQLPLSRPIMLMLMAGGSLVAGSDNPHFGIDAVGAVHPMFRSTAQPIA
jgi:hypothetical protein